MTPIIEFRNVSKTYGHTPIFTDLSFAVRKEEVIEIIGPSGAGKTTLIKLVAGMERPDGGRLLCRGRRIGYVFQEPRLIPWKTAAANIMLPLIAAGLGKKEAGERARAYIEKVGLKGFADHYPAKLSGGMVQRVALARAFAVEPDVLLFDEAFNGLDMELKAHMLALVEAMLATRPVTVLYVTHTPGEMKGLVNRVFRFTKGGHVCLGENS